MRSVHNCQKSEQSDILECSIQFQTYQQTTSIHLSQWCIRHLDICSSSHCLWAYLLDLNMYLLRVYAGTFGPSCGGFILNSDNRWKKIGKKSPLIVSFPHHNGAHVTFVATECRLKWLPSNTSCSSLLTSVSYSDNNHPDPSEPKP